MNNHSLLISFVLKLLGYCRRRAIGLALFSLSGSVFLSAQPVPQTFPSIWTNKGGDGRFDNPANWDTNVVPGANNQVIIQPSLGYIINLSTTGSTSANYSVFSLANNDGNNGPTLNLTGGDTGILTLNIIGSGVINGSSATGRSIVPWIINVGKNAVLKFSKAYNDGTTVITGNGAGGTAYDFINLSSNGVLDISQARFGTGTVRNPWDSRFDVQNQQLSGSSGTTVVLGPNVMSFNQNIARDGEILSATIDASGGGHANKGGSGYVVFDGKYLGANNVPSSLYDSKGYLVTANNVPTSVNDVTHQNDYINNNTTSISGLFVVKSNWGPIRMSSGDNNTLAGTGTVGTLIVERGIVNPAGVISSGIRYTDTSVGTLTVDGNFAIRGGAAGIATLQIDLGPGSTADKLVVNGQATVGGTSPDGTTTYAPRLVISSPTGFVLPGSFTFLSAAGGITGGFSNANITIPSSLSLSTPLPAIVGNNYVMTIGQLPFSAINGLTSSQQIVAHYLDYRLSQGNPADVTSFDPVIGAMNGKAVRNTTLADYNTTLRFNPPETIALLQQALNQLTPETYAHFYEAAISGFNLSIDAADRLLGRSRRSLQTGQLDIYTTYDYASVVTPGNLDYDQAKFKTSYFTVGADRRFGENLLAGGSFTLGKGRYALERSMPAADASIFPGSSATAKSHTLSGYGTYRKGKISLNGLLFVGLDKETTSRAVEKTRLSNYVTSSANAKRMGAGIWASYAQKLGWFTLNPYAGLYVMNWEMDGFTEKGNQYVALTVKKQSQTFSETRAGLKIESSFYSRNNGSKIFHFFVDASWLGLTSGKSNRTLSARLQGYDLNVATTKLDPSGGRATAAFSADITKAITFEIGGTGQTKASVDRSFDYFGTVSYKF